MFSSLSNVFVEFLMQSRAVFFLSLFSGLVLSMLIGTRLGQKRRQIIGERADEGASLVVGSMLGLLAFVLALNLSNASSRYDRRIESTLQEANAISTAILQAEAVGGVYSDSMVAGLKTYLRLRHDYVEADRHSPEIDQLLARANIVQNDLWEQVSALVRENPTPAASSLMNALNNAFDAGTAMRLAMEYLMPAQVVFLLLTMSLLGVGAVGYQFGLTGRRGRMPALVLSFLWCMVVIEIIDIGSARIWSFRTDPRVYDWTAESMGVAVPPAD